MTQLTREQVFRRRELTGKLAQRIIDPVEAKELRQILEIEKQDASKIGDILAIAAIGFLLAAVLSYLSDR